MFSDLYFRSQFPHSLKVVVSSRVCNNMTQPPQKLDCFSPDLEEEPNKINQKFLPIILIIGDSSATTRMETHYESTYFYKLKKELYLKYDIINNSEHGNDIRRILFRAGHFYKQGYNPDIVILNHGIVEAYPRPYPQHKYILKFILPLLRKFEIKFGIDKLLQKTKFYYTLADIFKFKLVPINEFSDKVSILIKDLMEMDTKIIIIGIVRPQKVLLKSKIVKKEFDKYNNVFKRYVDNDKIFFIDMDNIGEDFVIWDGYHYTDKGSEYVAKEVLKIISKLNKNDESKK